MKLKITPGPWVAELGEAYDVRAPHGGICARIHHLKGHHGTMGRVPSEEAAANAEFIAEAGTVANETGLMPRELLAQRDELLQVVELLKKAEQLVAENAQKAARIAELESPIARPLDDWHEDHGPVVWFTWEGDRWLGEPAWCGTPLDSDWPGYHTHWIAHPPFPKEPSP